MNDYEYELIGESIWDTYKNMAYLLSEISLEYIGRAAASGFRARQGQPQDLGQPGSRTARGGKDPGRDAAMKRIRRRLGAPQGYEGSPEARTFQTRFFAHLDPDAPPEGTVPPTHPHARRKKTDPSPLAQRTVRPELGRSRSRGNKNGNGSKQTSTNPNPTTREALRTEPLKHLRAREKGNQ